MVDDSSGDDFSEAARFDYQDNLDASGQKYADNLLQFNTQIINPKSEETFPSLNRDTVLANLKDKDVYEAMLDLDLSLVLDDMGLSGSAKLFQSRVSSRLNLSRSLEGFQQKQLTTSTVNQLKSYNIDQSKKGNGGLMGILRRGKG